MCKCSVHAKVPINVDLEMIFPVKDGMQTYKPDFDLPTEGTAVQ